LCLNFSYTKYKLSSQSTIISACCISRQSEHGFVVSNSKTTEIKQSKANIQSKSTCLNTKDIQLYTTPL